MKLPKRHMAAGFLLAFFSYTLADGVFNLAHADDDTEAEKDAYVEENRAATEEAIRQSTDLNDAQVRGAANAVNESAAEAIFNPTEE